MHSPILLSTNYLSAGSYLSPIPPASTPLSDDTWLWSWRSLTCVAPQAPAVPQTACCHHPSDPLNLVQPLPQLPSPSSIGFFSAGIMAGFRIGFQYSTVHLRSATKYLHSTHDHPEVVQQYLLNEVSERRVVGPLPKGYMCIKQTYINRFG